MSEPYYRIDVNAVLKPFVNLPQEPLAVTWKSPLKLRQEVERFATYFRRELSYDFQQFAATEKPKAQEKPFAAYLFINETNHYPRVWAGACCFRWREYQDAAPSWAAQWAWLHPYYRGKGIFSHAWEKFHELHENFICEPPFSPAMAAFLRKRGKCVLCWQPLDKLEGLTCTCCDERHKKTQDDKRNGAYFLHEKIEPVSATRPYLLLYGSVHHNRCDRFAEWHSHRIGWSNARQNDSA